MYEKSEKHSKSNTPMFGWEDLKVAGTEVFAAVFWVIIRKPS